MTGVETITLTKSPPGFDLTELLNKAGTEEPTVEPDEFRPSLPVIRINLEDHQVGLASRVEVFRQGPLWDGFSLLAKATYQDNQKVFAGKELDELAKKAGLDTRNNPGSILASRIRAKIEERPKHPKIFIKLGPPRFPHYQLRATIEYTKDSLINRSVRSNDLVTDRERTNELDRMAISKIKEGDKEAFTELYERYRERIYRQCFYRVSSPQEAEDLASVVFLNAFAAITQGKYINYGRPFIAYLLTITHNLLVDRYRTGKDTTSIEDVIIKADEATDPVVLAERSLASSELRSVIASLRRDQKYVVIARYFYGMEFWEIAANLNKSEGAVRVILSRTRRQLQANLNLRSLLEKDAA